MQTFIGIIFGGAFLAFLQFLITRHDNKVDKLADIKKALAEVQAGIKKLDEKCDRREAISVRVRILKFEDELLEGHRHSKDSFDQVLSDSTYYEQYCKTHPDFKNNQTAATVEHIKKVYHERLEKRDFA